MGIYRTTMAHNDNILPCLAEHLLFAEVRNGNRTKCGKLFETRVNIDVLLLVLPAVAWFVLVIRFRNIAYFIPIYHVTINMLLHKPT